MSVLVRQRSRADEAASADDWQLVEALRNGEEAVLTELQQGLQAALLRLARVYVSDESLAQDVVQETWLGVLRGLSRFEGRSSLKTWIFSILVRRAKTSALRERREGIAQEFGVAVIEDLQCCYGLAGDGEAFSREMFGRNDRFDWFGIDSLFHDPI